MAAQTTTAAVVSRELASLELMLGDLPEIAAEWASLGEGERVSWSLDWDQLMGVLGVAVDPSYRAGHMAADQQARYRAMLGKLRDALPIIERLGLACPPVSLDS